ncbi:MAG: type II secretion system protein GspF [Myxococcales bacterium]|nr:type II secretion system protein GspF [Myxococcales bacterium]
MTLYAYKGIGKTGKGVSGVKDAESPKALRQLMRGEGVTVTSSNVAKGKAGGGGGKGLSKEVDFGGAFNKVKRIEVQAFSRQLATMLNAGIALAECLEALFEQTEGEKFKHIVGEIRTSVNEGSSFGDTLANYPDVFDSLYVSMVRSGETAGNLEEVLSRLADFMESAAKLRSKVKGAMIYPVIMLVVGVSIMGVLMVAVVPKITGLFDAQAVQLPVNTRMLIWFSDFLGAYWLLLILGTIGMWVGFKVWSKTEEGRKNWHAMVLGMPLVGALVRQVAISRFCRTMGTMLKAGVPMLKVLETSKAVLGNAILMQIVEDAKRAITEGDSLAASLKRSGEFPPSVTHMIAVGEKSGALEDMLLRVADSYESEVETKLNNLTGMLEPIMLVVMGGSVAFVVFSILMPMMEMQKLTQM